MKIDFYSNLIIKCNFLGTNEYSLVSKMALSSALFMRYIPNLVFAGYYIVQNNKLIIGPYQGDVIACSPIKNNQGVCGNSFYHNKTIIVPDVNKFPGYISCDSITKSEIVIPIIQNNSVIAILDLDGKEYNQFDKIDSKNLEKIMKIIF